MQDQITREMTIEDIFKNFPSKSQKLAQEMTSAGLQCVGCCAATWETLEAGMYSHEYSDEEIDDLVDRLNTILLAKEDLNTISLSERAAKKFQTILEEEEKAGWGLRFGEKAAGCSGFEYVLDYSEKPKHGDMVFESHGIQIHVQQKSLERLLGCHIDYKDGLNGGFTITNSNVKGSCHCGSSHSY
ncbi:MAG TPA: iron-sulfur cluster assembly accessory protein [Chlamydiales bacterium]|jgi:iron-sulfur cluster assembly accessory protein|nr:iron-sulfur cluster assembly accessory protein [Chlamydiales bacterium]